MAVTQSARFGLTEWSDPADPFTRAQLEHDHEQIEALAVQYAQTAVAGRPAAGVPGRIHWPTDGPYAAVAPAAGAPAYDDGVGWRSLTADAVHKAGGDTIVASGAAVVPLTLRLAAGQTANGLEVQDSAGAVLARLNPGGELLASVLNAGPAISGAHLSVVTAASGNKGAVVRLASGQTVNAVEVQDSTGAVIGAIDAHGAGKFGPGSNGFANQTLGVIGYTPAGTVAVFRGAPAQVGNIAEYQSNAGGVLAKVRANGGVEGGRAFFDNGVSGETGFPGLVVRAAPGQSAAIVEAQDSAGATRVALGIGGWVQAFPTSDLQPGISTSRSVGNADNSQVRGLEHAVSTPGNATYLRTRARRYGGAGTDWQGVALELVRHTDASEQQRIGFMGAGGGIEYVAASTDGHRFYGGNVNNGADYYGTRLLVGPNGMASQPYYGGVISATALGASESAVQIRGGASAGNSVPIINVARADGLNNFGVYADGPVYARRGMAAAYSGAPGAQGSQGIVYVNASGQLRYLRGDGSDFYLSG